MIKVVKLEEYAISQRFEFEGKEYSVKGLTLGEQMEGKGTGYSVEDMLTRVAEITDMPAEVIKRLDDRQLGAILALSRGVELKPVEPEKKTEN